MTSATKTRALVGMRSGWATSCHIPVPQYFAPQYFAPQYLAVQPASSHEDAPQYFASQASGGSTAPFQGGAVAEPATTAVTSCQGEAAQDAAVQGLATNALGCQGWPRTSISPVMRSGTPSRSRSP